MESAESDEQLLSRFVRGDTAALGTLAQRYENALLGLASGLTNGRYDLAKDAVQDCWIRVIRYGCGFNGASSIKTWLYRIVINRCRDLREKQAARNGELERAGTAPGTSKAEGDEELARALERLAPESRLLLVLCYHHGLTHPQAADVLGIPVGTLKSRLHSALESLRSTLATERTP